MRNQKSLSRLLLAALLAAFALSACNTIEGVGKDVEAVGEEVKEEAREEAREEAIEDAVEDAHD